MIHDVFPLNGVWTDVYAETGLAVGTQLQIQNKHRTDVLIWEGAAAPVL